MKIDFFSWPIWTFFFYCYLSCAQTDRFQLALTLYWRQIPPTSNEGDRFSSLQWKVLLADCQALNKKQIKSPNSRCAGSPSGDQSLVAIDIFQHDLVFKP